MCINMRGSDPTLGLPQGQGTAGDAAALGPSGVSGISNIKYSIN